MSAGAGGPGVYNIQDAGGSGGGGALMNGTGPTAGAGANPLYSGMGGQGYGAGGGSGGCDVDSCAGCDAGGNGSPGLVYVEWILPRITFSESSLQTYTNSISCKRLKRRKNEVRNQENGEKKEKSVKRRERIRNSRKP